MEKNSVYNVEKEDKGNFGWAVLGFFFPLIGLILYLVWTNTKKKSSKQAGIGALVGFLSRILFSVLIGIIFYGFVWGFIQTDIVDNTCKSKYGSEYISIKEDETWYCKSTKTNEKIKLSDELDNIKIDLEDEEGKINVEINGKSKSNNDKYNYKKYEISELNTLINQLNFNKQLSDSNSSMNVQIDNNMINVSYFDNEYNYTINSIDNPVSIKIAYIDDCGFIYVLTKSGNVYRIKDEHDDIVNEQNIGRVELLPINSVKSIALDKGRFTNNISSQISDLKDDLNQVLYVKTVDDNLFMNIDEALFIELINKKHQ